MAKAYRCELCNGIIDRHTMICRDCGLNHSQYSKQHDAQVKFDRKINYTPRVDYTNISEKVNSRKKKMKIQNISTSMPSANPTRPKRGDYRVKTSNTNDDNKKRSPVITLIIVIIILNLISVVCGLIGSVIRALL